MSYITFKNICKSYDNKTQVLKGIDLEVEEGELLTLLGPSGCGKSTLLRCLAGLEQVQQGHILLEGRDITDLDARQRQIGMVFQQYSLFPNMTVEQNMAFGLKIQRLSKAEINDRITEALAMVGLQDKADAYPAQLSGGQQQRIAIARALATDPKVLLCDEATSALDPNTTHQILQLIRDINKKLGITVVIITHQMSVVKEICDKVAILDGGVVAEDGMVSTVFAAPKSAAGRRLVFPGAVDELVSDPMAECRVRLIFRSSEVTSHPLIAHLAADEGIYCNVLSADTQKLSDNVYGSMLLGIPRGQVKRAIEIITANPNIQAEEVDEYVR